MGLTRSALLDYAQQGIRINAVNPGLIATDMMNRLADGNPEQMASIVAMGRLGQPEELRQPLCSCVLMLPVTLQVSLS